MNAPDARAQALIGLGLCEVGRRLNSWSQIVLVCALIAWSRAPAAWLMLALGGIFALGAAYQGGRLAFDRPIFAAWAQTPESELPAALSAFDAVLNRSTPRPLAERLRGVRRHLLWQGVCLLAQGATLAASLARGSGHA